MNIPSFTIKDLLEAGVHYGHSTRRWNPKMAPYIYGVHNDVHIIDLQQTAPMLQRALAVTQNVIASGGRMLFVGTKRQAQDVVAKYAASCGQYYVNKRWLGGTLTNWKTATNSINRLNRIESEIETGLEGLTKKETIQVMRERDKLNRGLGGIKDMGGVPNLIFVLDTNKESLAILEARKLNIPVIGILDTNSSPDAVDYGIPGNDDAIRAIELYCDLISQAVLSGISSEVSKDGASKPDLTEIKEEVE